MDKRKLRRVLTKFQKEQQAQLAVTRQLLQQKKRELRERYLKRRRLLKNKRFKYKFNFIWDWRQNQLPSRIHTFEPMEPFIIVPLVFILKSSIIKLTAWLLRKKEHLYSFFFVKHLAYYFNLLCLFNRFSFNPMRKRRTPVRAIWKKTKVAYGRYVFEEIVEIKDYVFFGVMKAFIILELRVANSVDFNLFDYNFLITIRRQVYFLFSCYLWYDFLFFLSMKSYLYAVTAVRYNEYIMSILTASNPWARALFIHKFRLYRFRARYFQIFVLEQFSAYLFFGKFVFYRHWDAFYNYYFFFYNRSLTFMPFMSHKLLMFIFNTPRIFLFKFMYLWLIKYQVMYFTFIYLQNNPRKFQFTKAFIHVWYRLYVIGSHFNDAMGVFLKAFYFDAETKFCFLLLASNSLTDVSFLESFLMAWPSLAWRDIWFAALDKLTILNYTKDDEDNFSVYFAINFVNFEMIFDLIEIIAYFSHWWVIKKLFFSTYFQFFSLKNFVPFSYAIYIYWRILKFDIVLNFFNFKSNLVFFFDKIFIDSFFLNRFVSAIIYLRISVTKYLQFLKDEYYSGRGRKLKRVLLAENVFFFFFLQDLFYKFISASKAWPIYIFFFLSLVFFKYMRIFFRSFLRLHFVLFRRYLESCFLQSFVPKDPASESFFDLRWKMPLRRRFRKRLFRHPTYAAIAVGRKFKVPSFKWYRVFEMPKKEARKYFLRRRIRSFYYMVYSKRKKKYDKNRKVFLFQE